MFALSEAIRASGGRLLVKGPCWQPFGLLPNPTVARGITLEAGGGGDRDDGGGGDGGGSVFGAGWDLLIIEIPNC